MDPADRSLPEADVRIVGDKIDEIGAAGSLARPGDLTIDCRDTLIIPGLVNTHTHAATSLFRGLVEDLPREYWRERYAVPGQQRFDLGDYRFAARASCIEFLLNGVTCIADRWSGMGAIAEELDASGIRAVVGETLTDRFQPANWKAADELIERWGVKPDSRVTAAIAPHAPDTCSDGLLQECARRAEQLGCRVYLHLAQSAYEIARLRERGYDGAVAILAANGLANARTVAAHCIYLSAREIEEWDLHRISIAHCPASNIKIEARTAAIHKLIGRACIGLGTDWTASDNAMDLLAEARFAALIGKHVADDPTALPVRAMLRMMTIDGARALGLDEFIGSIEPGKKADLVVLDLDALEANPRHDLEANLLYSMSTRCVRDVMVDGAFLVRDGKPMKCDLRQLKEERARRWQTWSNR